MIKLKDLIVEAFPSAMELETEIFRQSLVSKYPQIEGLYFHTSGHGVLHISEIKIKKEFRRKGIGSQIIQEIKDFADKHNLTITLSPAPEHGYKKKLFQFYKDSGFVKNKGRHRDYRISSPFGLTMYRKPGMNESLGQKVEVPKEPGTVPIPHNHIR